VTLRSALASKASFGSVNTLLIVVRSPDVDVQHSFPFSVCGDGVSAATDNISVDRWWSIPQQQFGVHAATPLLILEKARIRNHSVPKRVSHTRAAFL